MNLPNAITIARILLVPVIIYLLTGGAYQTAFWLFIGAGISDGVDGFIAKRFNQETELGAYLDPIADKALLVAMFITLGVGGYLPVALVFLVVSRDIIIVGAILLSWVLERQVVIAPLMVSKVNTTVQILLVGVVMGNLAFDLGLEIVIYVLIAGTAIFTLWSGISYLMHWAHDMADQEKPAPPEATKDVLTRGEEVYSSHKARVSRGKTGRAIKDS